MLHLKQVYDNILSIVKINRTTNFNFFGVLDIQHYNSIMHKNKRKTPLQIISFNKSQAILRNHSLSKNIHPNIRNRNSLSKIKTNNLEYLKTPKKNQKTWLQQQNLQNTWRKTNNIMTIQLLYQPIKFSDFTAIRINRARFIDWLLEVCHFFKLSWSTYWSTIQMIDTLILEHHYVSVDTIHLIGVVCLFMCSKTHEYKPLRITEITQDITHRAYTKQQVIQQQGVILNLFLKSNRLVSSLTIFELLLQVFPQGTSTQIFQCLRQLILVWMDPSRSLKQDETYKQLITRTIISVLQRKNLPNIQNTQLFFRVHYGCKNSSKYNSTIKW